MIFCGLLVRINNYSKNFDIGILSVFEIKYSCLILKCLFSSFASILESILADECPIAKANYSCVNPFSFLYFLTLLVILLNKISNSSSSISK